MKTFYNLPKSEGEEKFYTRYATLVPTLDVLSYLSQVVSAFTEFGIIYAIIYSSLSPLWPEDAGTAAIIGAITGTAFLEIGLRKFLPYSTRAIIRKRWRGWDGWISGFVIVATIALLTTSGLLSFGGSHYLVGAVAPKAEVITNTLADSTRTAAVTFNRQHYGELIKAVEQLATADIIDLDAEYTALVNREARTGKRYTTQKDAIRQKLEKVKADRSRKIATLRTEQSTALAQVEATHQDELTTVKADNLAAATAANALVDSYGGNLGYFTLVCLFAFIVCVTVKELHHVGAGIDEQVEPGAFDFEAPPLAAFMIAVKGRADRFIYGIIHRIEKGTTDAPEPVAAPTLWKRDTNTLKFTETSEGVSRKLGKAAPKPVAAKADERRRIGFEQQPNEDTKPRTPLLHTENTKEQEHETLNPSDIKQRLRLYKKRLGSHEQKAIKQERTTGEVKARTAEAIANNRQWVNHYQTLLSTFNHNQ